MRDKINKCINRSYNEEGEFSRVKAIEELEGLFDSEILSFISFLRENYSITYNNEIEDNLNGDILNEKELFNKFLEQYERV